MAPVAENLHLTPSGEKTLSDATVSNHGAGPAVASGLGGDATLGEQEPGTIDIF